jgi:hypothetical protein
MLDICLKLLLQLLALASTRQKGLNTENELLAGKFVKPF